MVSKNLTIMFTDMKGFTKRTSKNSRSQVENLLDLQDEIVLPVIARFGGNVIKTMGDSYMVTFESPTSAVLCGIKIQEAVLAFRNFELRIAINTGDVNVKKGDVFGEPVNLASRLEGIAKPKEVLITEAVYLAMNRNEIYTTMVGPRVFKGIPFPVEVYRVLSKKSNLALAKHSFLKNFPKVAILSFCFFVLGGVLFWRYGFDKKTNSAVEAMGSSSPEATIAATSRPIPVTSFMPLPTPTSNSKGLTPTPVPTLNPTEKVNKFGKWGN